MPLNLSSMLDINNNSPFSQNSIFQICEWEWISMYHKGKYETNLKPLPNNALDVFKVASGIAQVKGLLDGMKYLSKTKSLPLTDHAL